VTNAQFQKFVEATGYVTLAERPVDPKRHLDWPQEMLVPGSIIFVPPKDPPALLAVDERFATLAADFMAQVDAKLEAFRAELLTQFGQNVHPLHKDLHDLLDM
jgi:hypothetical protein